MTELLTLIALWCAPLANGVAVRREDFTNASVENYAKAQDCRKRAWSCLEYGRKSYSPEQLQKCLLQGHPEKE